jgi:hypothetical protein
MDIKTNIENLLNDLKRMGKDRRKIETDLKYSTFYIDQLLSKGGNTRFYNALKRYHEMLMENAWLEKSMVREPHASYGATPVTQPMEAEGEWEEGKGFWSALPEYKNCDFATKAKGNSMLPFIQHNAIVGGKKLADASVIIYGEIYIVHTRNGIEAIKYIQPAPDPGNILLVSGQENTPATMLNRSDILRLYQARFVLNPL